MRSFSYGSWTKLVTFDLMKENSGKQKFLILGL